VRRWPRSHIRHMRQRTPARTPENPAGCPNRRR
jgi:hypothetical protein